jgi:hypothetical protein
MSTIGSAQFNSTNVVGVMIPSAFRNACAIEMSRDHLKAAMKKFVEQYLMSTAGKMPVARQPELPLSGEMGCNLTPRLKA